MEGMLKMRLQRVGRKHDPSFRIVVTEHTRGPRAGVYVDLVGQYNARFGKPTIDGEKAKMWLGRGVQTSDTVHNLLVDAGIVPGKKRNVLPKKTAPKKEEPVAEVKAASPAPAAESAPATEEPKVEATEEAPVTAEVTEEAKA